MPTRPKRPCRHAGCPVLTESGWCEKHESERRVRSRWSGDRGSASSRGYGAVWRKLRRMILNRDPVCTVCERAPSTEVDHLVPKVDGGLDTDENLRGICHACHDAKTKQEGDRARRLRRPGFRGSLPS